MTGAWRQLFTRRMLICVVTGFSSGLPLFLLLNLVPAWLKTEGVDLKTIGAFALVQFPYTWKFIWSPLLDRYVVPVLGRRRGWMLISQVGLMALIILLGAFSPHHDISTIAVICTLFAFMSATQDISLDAYRRELLTDAELGLGNGVAITAYRLSALIPGSLSLALSEYLSWSVVFTVTALFMLPGMAMALLVQEPHRASPPRTLREAVVEPFHEFITRQGGRYALLILTFVFFYKLGDSMCTALATPFYLEMGFSRMDLALVAKHAGTWPNLIGAVLGGLWMFKLGINRGLWVFGLAQLVTIFGFAWLASLGHHAEVGALERTELALVVGLEAFGTGMGTVAFVAYIARTTNPAYTATQLALFTSLAAVPRTFMNASAGWFVEFLGWTGFFLLCAVLAVPGMLLLFKVAPWNEKPGNEKP
jgi:PAT family beta-lactamase induction signal transducer AmpG